VVGGKRIRHPLEEPGWPTEAEAAHALLFKPIRVGRALELEQRTWVPAMVPWRARESGEVTPEVIAWYGRFATGRPGAIVVEATGIRDIASGPLLRIGDDRFISGLKALVETVKRASDGHTRLFIQIIDFLSIRRRPPPDKYFLRFFAVTDAHRVRMAASLENPSWETAPESNLRAKLLDLELAGDARVASILSTRELEDLRFGARERVTDMHLEHIRALPSVLPDFFARAALRAEKAGFDGVELHFAHAYTMASFLSRTNDRDDGYGGSQENRIRLPLEVYAKTRDALRPDTVLGCRFLGDEVIVGGSRVEDAVFYGRALANAGMDYLSLSKGGRFEDAKLPKVGHAAYPYTGQSGHECMPTVYSDERGPFGRNLDLSRAVRAGVRALSLETPIVAAGGIATFATAEGALRRGDADIIASARQSLADPDWFLKMRLGLGDEIRRCQLTNYCEGLDQQHKQVTCRLWDRELPGAASEAIPMTDDGKRRLVAPEWEKRAKVRRP
jgi:2,4-dienoyl-CoA reductase-like NADH-dependent reductase (Old Yellow Enzyme family)